MVLSRLYPARMHRYYCTVENSDRCHKAPLDGLAKALASGGSRRSVLKGLFGLGGATALDHASGAQAARRPTPAPKPVSCPGPQVRDRARCGCPTGFDFGPDCYETPEQCCDNACCPAGSVCISEELCCPAQQVCPDYPGGPCCPDGLLCCPGGDGCFDPDGGYCIDADCPSDSCNLVSCQDNSCIYQHLPDGTDCGDCAACQGGDCTRTCDDGTCCTDDDVCVDRMAGGCCDNSDCPSDACNPALCENHQCQVGGSEACHTITGNVCCNDGEHCAEFAVVQGVSLGACCPSGASACLTLDGLAPTPVCCASGTHCIATGEITEDLSSGVCCSDETAICMTASGSAVCCESGTHCVQLGTVDQTSFGTCCAEDSDACLIWASDSVTGVCCGTGTQCSVVDQLESEQFSIGACCEDPAAACVIVEGGMVNSVCCPSGTQCNMLPGGPFGACCPSGQTVCETSNGPVCCTPA